jgi:chromosome segregation ATPase
VTASYCAECHHGGYPECACERRASDEVAGLRAEIAALRAQLAAAERERDAARAEHRSCAERLDSARSKARFFMEDKRAAEAEAAKLREASDAMHLLSPLTQRLRAERDALAWLAAVHVERGRKLHRRAQAAEAGIESARVQAHNFVAVYKQVADERSAEAAKIRAQAHADGHAAGHAYGTLERAARALLAALPHCDALYGDSVENARQCYAPATRAHGRGGLRWCDAHAEDAPEYPRAAAVRALAALLGDGAEAGGAGTAETTTERSE